MLQNVLMILGAVLSIALVMGVIWYFERSSASKGKIRRVDVTPEVPPSFPPAPESLSEPQEPVKESPAVVPAPASAPAPVQISQTDRVSRGLSRTKVFFQQTFDKLFSASQAEVFFNDLEEVLLMADVGIQTSEAVVKELRGSFGVKLPNRDELKAKLSEILLKNFAESPTFSSDAKPHVIMIVGINGAGKTTTIGKLAQRFRTAGKSVIVGAADTFRPAAIEQLKTWIERAGAEGVFQKEGADPSAVAFDTVQAALSRGTEVCIIDTAGRLHTKSNLMEELSKMKRVITKAMATAPHDIWLVIDGSTGQNALQQAREFHSHLGLTGLVVTKLDGSAKGGALIAVAGELKVPVVFIGVGETAEDLIPFEPKLFMQEILAGL